MSIYVSFCNDFLADRKDFLADLKGLLQTHSYGNQPFTIDSFGLVPRGSQAFETERFQPNRYTSRRKDPGGWKTITWLREEGRLIGKDSTG